VGGGTVVDCTAAVPTFTKLAFGGLANSSSAIASDEYVYSWGMNSKGQLGNATTTDSSVPVRLSQGAIPAGVHITQTAAGYQSAYGLGSDGNVYAWGWNSDGQLGNGTTTDSVVPVRVLQGAIPAGVHITQIAAGTQSAYGLGSDGNVYAWGYNSDGQLGNGTTTDSSVPVQVSQGAIPAGVHITQISGISFTAYALGSDGNVYAWGYNFFGQLGDGTTTDSSVPVQVSQGAIPAGVHITQIAAGSDNGYALGSDGNAYAWGNDGDGQLGDGTTTNSTVPVQVLQGAIPVGVHISQLVAGAVTGYVLGSDGNVYSWGDDYSGELGDAGSAGNYSTVPVLVSQGAIPAGVHITQFEVGNHAGYVLGSDGKIYSWGFNGNGALGNGTTTYTTAVPVLGPNFVTTGVLFDGTAGTGLAVTSTSCTVTSTPHSAGAVDVTIQYSVFGGSTAGATGIGTVIPDGFTYLATLAATGSDPTPTLGMAILLLVVGSVLILVRRRVVQAPRG
jgi:LPXTG-motif cell wall-anchored protein